MNRIALICSLATIVVSGLNIAVQRRIQRNNAFSERIAEACEERHLACDEACR